MELKTLVASDSLYRSVLNGNRKFNRLNVQDLSDRCTPGEWFYLIAKADFKYLCYANPLGEKGLCLRVCAEITEEIDLKKWLHERLIASLALRKRMGHDLDSSRIVYGQSDDLPGLIIDSYQNMVVIEVNTMGMWNLREHIKQIIQDLSGKKVIIRTQSTQDENLPEAVNEVLTEDITILEDGIEYLVQASTMQKLGFYYDHRENRLKLRALISRLKESGRIFKTGLDLFCYHGAWCMGLKFVKSGS